MFAELEIVRLSNDVVTASGGCECFKVGVLDGDNENDEC
jgi:hypothetical protein